jgi:hypothetical protein
MIERRKIGGYKWHFDCVATIEERELILGVLIFIERSNRASLSPSGSSLTQEIVVASGDVGRESN